MVTHFSSIIINNEAVRKIQGGELWLPDKSVIGRKPKLAGIVDLLDKRRQFVGHAFLSPHSRYYIRIFSKTRAKIDKEFWRHKIISAYKRRHELEKITNAFRVVHSEADGIPSVVIDKYNDIWSIQITSEGSEGIKKQLKEIICEEFHPASVIYKNDTEIRRKEGLSVENEIAFGIKYKTEIIEGDNRFEVDVLSGQKTGAYLDYRSFRFAAREFAKEKCLDAFCYQGWFSCQIAPFADYVVALDSSANAIETARRNAIINGHKNIEFIKTDVFDYLSECSDKFNFIHLDPPSFAKGGGKIDAAIRGYVKLVNYALKLIEDRGTILISSCSHNVTEGVLEKVFLQCVKKSGLEYKIIYRGIQDKDHPVLEGFPESLYLKAIAAEILLP